MALELNMRAGETPKIDGYVPHQQIDNNSSEQLFKDLLDWVETLDHVTKTKSRTSVLTAIGLYIDPDVTINTKAEREFSHINTEPGPGSFHVKLPTEDLDIIVANKWGVYHPMSESIKGIAGKVGVALVYAPRDADDLEVAKNILSYAYKFAIDKA